MILNADDIIRGSGRAFLRGAVMSLAVFGSAPLWADPNIVLDSEFRAADASRTRIDIGGVWDGTTDISASGRGDTMALQIIHESSNEAAKGVIAEVFLPDGITYFNDSASAEVLPGCAFIPVGPIDVDDGVGSDQTGGSIEFFLANGALTLPTTCTVEITYEIMAVDGVATGVNQFEYSVSYSADSFGGAVVNADPEIAEVNVLRGAKVLTYADINPTASVKDIVPWDLSLQNTGSGGLFDVIVQINSVNPGPSLQLLEVIQNSTGAPTAIGLLSSSPGTACTLGPANGSPPCDAFLIPFLEPRQILGFTFQTEVIDCFDINAVANAFDRVDAVTGKSLTGQVTLDLEEPLINFVAPNIQFQFIGSTTVQVTINGTGLGDARDLDLTTNLNALGLIVESVTSPNWTESNGVFTYSGGDFPGGGSDVLEFEIRAADICNDPNGGTVTWQPTYTDVCGNPFKTPTRFDDITGPFDEPSIELSKFASGQASSNRLDLNQSAEYRLRLDSANIALLADGEQVVVTDILPTNIGSVGTPILPAGTGSTVTCPGGTCEPGEQLVWTVDPDVWTGGQIELIIPFVSSSDACVGGGFVTNTATLSPLTTAGAACTLPEQVRDYTLQMGNSPNVNATIEFDPLPPTGGSSFKTGTPNADCVASEGEGECITQQATYQFDVGYPGTWTDATYTDNFGGVSAMSYIPGTAQISVNGGGSYTTISASCVSVNAAPSTDRLSIDMGCALVTGLGDDGNVSGDNIALRYSVTVDNSALGTADSIRVNPLSRLTVPGGATGTGACTSGGAALFSLPTSVTVSHPISLVTAISQAEIGICEEFPVTLQVTNNSFATGERSRDQLTQFVINSDYNFIDTSPITFGGVFTGSIDTDLAAAGGPTFEYDIGSNDSHDEGLSDGQQGTINFVARRRAQSAAGFGQSGVSATVFFDDNQTVLPFGASRAYSNSNVDNPVLITEGELTITASPQLVTVTGETARWVAFVTNGGNGVAYNTIFENQLPANTVPRIAEMNTANTAICNSTARPVTVIDNGGGMLAFDLGDIGSGESCTVTIVAEVLEAAECNIPDKSNLMTASWGCGGNDHQGPNAALSPDQDPVKDDSPDFLFLDGELEVNHLDVPPDDSYAELCTPNGQVVIELRNIGGSSIFDISLLETLDSSEGLSYVAGSAELSINGGAYSPIGDPDTSTGADTLLWTYTGNPSLSGGQLPALLRLWPLAEASAVGDTSKPNFVRIRFRIDAEEDAFDIGPTLSAAAIGTRACGSDLVTSTPNQFTVPVRSPELEVVKQGRVGTEPYGEQVVAEIGETVEWQIDITNNGDVTAQNLRIRDLVPTVPGSVSTFTGGTFVDAPLDTDRHYDLPDLGSGDTVTVNIKQTIPAGITSCPNALNTAFTSFGCEPVADPNSPSGLPLSPLQDTAQLVLAPIFNAGGGITQTLTALSNNRQEFSILFTNTGAPASLVRFSDTLPSAFTLDSSFPATYELSSGGGQVAMTAAAGSTPTVPAFDLSGISLDTGESVTFRFRVLPRVGFDPGPDQFTTFETDGVNDPNFTAFRGTNVPRLVYRDQCNVADLNATRNILTEPPTVDIEIEPLPLAATVTEGEVFNMDFRLRNIRQGVGDNLVFTLPPSLFGGGSTINSVQVTSANGTVSVCDNVSPYTCEASEIGSIGPNQSAVVRVNATANNNGLPLNFGAKVVSELLDDAGNSTGLISVNDERRTSLVGLDVAKTIVNTSVLNDTLPFLVIGETLTYDVEATWFGLDFANGDTLSDIVISERLPSEIAYIDVAEGASNNATLESGSPFPSEVVGGASADGNAGQTINFNLSDIGDPSVNGTFNARFDVKLPNNATTQGMPATAAQIRAIPTVFDFNFNYSGNSEPVSDTRSIFTRLIRPELSLDVEVRRSDAAVADFSDLAGGDAGDQFQYRVRIRNEGSGPAYDVSLTDLFQTDKLTLVSAAVSHGVDTNAFPGDGVVDITGGVITTPSTDQIFFDQNDVAEASLPVNQKFARLLQGNELILLYSVDSDISVNPGELLNDNAILNASTVPGIEGEQDPAAADDFLGEWLIQLNDSASIVVVEASVNKAIVNTSVGGDTSPNVLVGEQVEFEVLVSLPESTSPNFRVVDSLPEGLRLVSATAAGVSYSPTTNVSCANTAPVITPSSQPANGAVQLVWEFGDCVVNVSSTSIDDRRITIRYIAQVLNIPTVIDDTAANTSPVDNSVAIEFGGNVIATDSVDLLVEEAEVEVTLSLETLPAGETVDSGLNATYRVRVQNNSTDVTAYDLHILSGLPDELTAVPGSVTFVGGDSANITDLGDFSVDSQGNAVTWGRLSTLGENLDLEPGSFFEFTFEAELNDTIEPAETLIVPVAVDWTSLDDTDAPLSGALGDEGTIEGERTGGTVAQSGSNTLEDEDTNDELVSDDVVQLNTHTASNVSKPGEPFQIGDIVEYTLVFDVQEGVIPNLVISDLLPDGFEYLGTNSINGDASPFEDIGPFDYDLNDENGALGGIDGQIFVDNSVPGNPRWVFGDLQNVEDGAADQITIVYQAQITDSTTFPEGQAVITAPDTINDATLLYDDTDGPGLNNNTNLPVPIDILQPILQNFNKTLPNGSLVAGNQVVPVEITFDSDPTGGIAYNTVIEDRIPDELSALVSSGNPVVIELVQIDGVDVTANYDDLGEYVYIDNAGPDADVLRIPLNDADTIPPGASVVIRYSVQTVPSLPVGFTTTAEASIPSYSSQPGTPPVERETNDPALVDSVTFTTVAAPIVAITKNVINTDTAQNPGRDAIPGDVLQYVITLENTGGVDATGASLIDDPDGTSTTPFFLPGSLNVLSIPPGASDNSSATGGAQSTGLVSLANITIPAGDSVTVIYEIEVAGSAPLGTISTQAELTVPTFAPLLSDDVVDGGTGTPAPTITNIGAGARPDVVAEKSSIDLDDASELRPGDRLQYTIRIRNEGAEQTVNTTFVDAVPANTSYVIGSTTLNGAPIADAAGDTFPFSVATGREIHSDGAADGVLETQASGTKEAIITFVVLLEDNLVDGTLISNQGTVNGEGQTSGPFPPVPTDDPNTTVADDPTINVVGRVPVLDATKVALHSSPLAVGDTVTYTIGVSNVGNAVATNVEFTDPLNTAELLYVAGSLEVSDTSGVFSALTDASGDDDGDVDTAASPNLVSVELGDLAIGETRSVRFQVTVQATGRLDNQGSVTGDDLPDEPTDVDGDDTNGDQPTPVFVGTGPALDIVKEVIDVNGGFLFPEEEIEYRVIVENIGAGDATVVTLEDLLDGTISYVPGTLYVNGVLQTDGTGDDQGDFGGTTPGTITIVTDSGDPLSPGEKIEVRYRATVAPGTPLGTTIDSPATASTPGADSVTDNAPIQVGGTPELARISGSVWLDSDHDKEFDRQVELGLENWTVTLLQNGRTIGTALTNSDGSYQFNGVQPGSGFSVEFGRDDSNSPLGISVPTLGTPGLLQITDITLQPGDNILDENLPVDPSGVIYDSVSRAPIAGAVLELYRVDGGLNLLVDDDCVGGPGAQGQVTAADGFYAFFVSPGADAATCPDNPTVEYELRVTAPAGYQAGPSVAIPPAGIVLDGNTCPADAVPATINVCEVQAQNTAPAGADSTVYYLQFHVESGSKDIVRNHIPLDPVSNSLLSLTKTTPLLNVTRGQLVPYVITARNSNAVAINNVDIRDNFPAGFKYVEGSGIIDGVKDEPVINGRVLTWGPVSIPANGSLEVKLLLIVGAGVSEAKYTNTAQAFNSGTDNALSNLASATVRVVPDPSFDCTDVIGQVFDDKNRNGYQDAGEEGLPGVRVSTARGLLVTTDANGRYHITCAIVPNEDRGSNFIVKVDDRTLPSGYRMTTENPRVKRVTRGKMAKFNFGAAIHRVVRLDLGQTAFIEGSRELSAEKVEQLGQLLNALKDSPSTLRLSYLGRNESERLVKRRLAWVRKVIENSWKDMNCCYELVVETEVFWRDGAPPGEARAAREVRR